MIHKYFIPYDTKAKIDYIYLLSIYNLAEYNKSSKCYDTVFYRSIKSLADLLKLSQSSVKRRFADTNYNTYYTIDRQQKKITLNNNVNTNKLRSFVVLSNREVDILLRYNDNLLVKYYLYIKYYCGYSADKPQDFTATQFLQSISYSIKSNNQISKISEYNKYLIQNNLIKITHYRDNSGHLRNVYTTL